MFARILVRSASALNNQLGSTRTMASRAVFSQHGAPMNAIKLESFDDPTSPKDNEVVVKMMAAPINPSDLNIIEGTYPLKPEALPATAGNEGVGVITHVGAGVKNLKVDDWVIPSEPLMGTWTTHMVAAEDKFLTVSKNLPVEYAATLSVNPCTAYRLLQDFEQLQPGDLVVQNGANSAVGQCVIQIAASRGIRTVSLLRDRPNFAEVAERLKGLGADVVVSNEYSRTPGFQALLDDLPPAKLALNTVGGEAVGDVSRLLRNGGTLVTYGGMSRKPVTMPTGAYIFKDVSAKGFWMTNWNTEHTAEERKAMLDELTQMVLNGDLKMWMERENFNNSLADAVHKATQSYRDRKVVLTMDNA